jgi:hypothetical protein
MIFISNHNGKEIREDATRYRAVAAAHEAAAKCLEASERQ